MKRLVFTFLSTAAVCAVVSATPALAAPGGADAHAMANQAQIHPTEANHPPVWSPNGVAEGEVYPAEQAYGRGYGAAEPADVVAAVPRDAARVIMELPFGAADAYAPAPYGADDANVPGRLSASAARARRCVCAP